MNDVELSHNFRQFLSGKLGRRDFLRRVSHSSLALVVFQLSACAARLSSEVPRLRPDQEPTLRTALDIIFPKEVHAPGAEDVNAAAYLQLVLLDPRVGSNQKELICHGLDWLNEESQSDYHAEFQSLRLAEQELLISRIVENDWGERWVSRLLSYVFEALLGDPIHGGNPGGIGWRWLDHHPGYPRPSVTVRSPVKTYERV